MDDGRRRLPASFPDPDARRGASEGPGTIALRGALVALFSIPLVAQAQFVAEALPGGATAWTRDAGLVAAGDVDRDGDVDLVCSEDRLTPGLAVLVNDGQGRFARGAARFSGSRFTIPATVLLADFDRDGDPDVLTTANGGTAEQWRNDGRGFFHDVSAATLPPNRTGMPATAWVADVDGDGAPDVLFPHVAWRNLGGGTFQEQALPWRDVSSVRVADVNGDGRMDVIGDRSGGLLDVYANQGAWRFSYLSSVPAFLFSRPSPEAFELADVDGDGDVDVLVVALYYSRLWRNDGTGRFSDSPGSIFPPVTYSAAARLRDFDEDGDVDLWMGNGQGFAQPDQLYTNDGSGRFTDVTATRVQQVPRGTVALATADVDGDGDLDVVAVHGDATGAGVLCKNLLRDVAFAGPVRIGTTAVFRIAARRGFAPAPQLAVAAVSTRALVGPIVLPPLGAWRLDPVGLIVLPAVVIPALIGETTFGVPVPGRLDLVGQVVSVQALVAHEAAPSSWRLTGAARAPIAR